ncbi:hypothetical protein E3N88_14748 [Mikania micrantha]|uniref:Uncharacterized protein n=1 Tax=Mikania micrantha TaxID=192012 RepID=A0A5N6P3K4_9ASTR|nr:hypothetical protein E3N88_14748 [Mikania micrantha]
MGRAPCCDKASVKKGPWSPEEDALLKEFIQKHGTGGNWIALPHKAGLKRCGKSCRLRWLNYLRPNIKHGEFSEDEDRIICSLYASIGSRWSIIASQLPGRTDNDIKNYWNTKLRKKLLAVLPSFQKKPSFFPSMAIQSQPVSDHKSDYSFFNASSSFYNYNPNLLNVGNNMNSLLLLPTTTTTVTNQFSQPLSPASGMISNLGFQNQNMSNECYCPDVKESVLMFGYGDGNCMSQIRFNKDHHQIKQENQFVFNTFGDQNRGFMTDHHNYDDQKQKGCFSFKNLEEVKQLIGISSSDNINVDINSFLMNDDDENKTTHIITDGFCMIDGSN